MFRGHDEMKFRWALPLFLLACGSQELEVTPTPAGETPPAAGPDLTATPTPVPTLQLDTWQKMTRLELESEEGMCLDLDGDGSPDNGLPEALAELASSLLEAITADLNAMVESGEINDQQALLLKNLAEEVLNATLSVESINAALANDIEEGDGFMAYNLRATTDHSTLFFWEAYEQGSGAVIVPRGQVGETSGADDPLAGEAYFGPGAFELGTVIMIPETPESPAQAIDLTFYVADAAARLDYDPTFTKNGVMGGGLNIIALGVFIESVLEAALDSVMPIDLSSIMDPIYDQLLQLSDMDCSDGDPCMSTCLSFDAVTAVVATP